LFHIKHTVFYKENVKNYATLPVGTAGAVRTAIAGWHADLIIILGVCFGIC